MDHEDHLLIGTRTADKLHAWRCSHNNLISFRPCFTIGRTLIRGGEDPERNGWIGWPPEGVNQEAKFRKFVHCVTLWHVRALTVLY
jgi:hypothetical protein